MHAPGTLWCLLPLLLAQHAAAQQCTARYAGDDAPSCRQSTTGTFLGVEGVPRLGLGLAALGRPGYINIGHSSQLAVKTPSEMKAYCSTILDEAYRLGIRYYDGARSYGKSEEFLASWIDSRGHGKAPVGKPVAENIVCGSKWGYLYTADWRIDTNGEPHEVKDHTLSTLQKQTVETNELLGKNLTLYQVSSSAPSPHGYRERWWARV
jgi:aryl-alcohol dehydrogenase-like predicted oxidoreductase